MLLKILTKAGLVAASLCDVKPTRCKGRVQYTISVAYFSEQRRPAWDIQRACKCKPFYSLTTEFFETLLKWIVKHVWLLRQLFLSCSANLSVRFAPRSRGSAVCRGIQFSVLKCPQMSIRPSPIRSGVLHRKQDFTFH